MKYNKNKDANFWLLARKFLHEYMPIIKNLSRESVKTYKQALKDYISFLKNTKSIEVIISQKVNHRYLSEHHQYQ